MRVLVGKTTYGMNQEEYIKLLNVASKQVPRGIYAIEKDDYCELKAERYSSIVELNKQIKEYKEQGFLVYHNY